MFSIHYYLLSIFSYLFPEVTITDTETKQALIPAASEPEVNHAPQKTKKSRRAGIFDALRGLLLSFFSCTALTVFALCTLSALIESNMGAYYPVQLMLGRYFGGADAVEVIPAAEKRHAGFIHGRSESEKTENALPPSPKSEAPTAKNEDSIIRITLASEDKPVNETPYDPDITALARSPRTIPPLDELYTVYGSDAPVVLILHTHGTEAYAESEADNYRSSDREKNIVSCGEVIASVLNERGIHTIHSAELYDEADFTMAYYSASLAIKRILRENPSVKYIIDVHRDSVLTEGVHAAPSVEYDDAHTAQMMFVVGTDHGGSGHRTWKNNFALALRLQNALNGETEGIMRSINLRSASFNEQYADGSLLLEIGACGTPLEEAHRSAEIFAQALADEIIGQ